MVDSSCYLSEQFFLVSFDAERADDLARAGIDGGAGLFHVVRLTQRALVGLADLGADIDLRNVDITTRDAVVTLRGYQESNRDIDNLISSTRTVRGVRDVRNELTLNNRGYNDPYPRR